MEIFIAYTKHSDVTQLALTLDAWDEIEGAEVVMLECEAKKYELFRRVTAEQMSRGDYILGEVGVIPTYESFIVYAERMLAEHPKVGMFSMSGAIHICRKGVIEKWPEKKSDFYIPEHKRAYLLEGYTTETTPEVYCQRIQKAS